MTVWDRRRQTLHFLRDPLFWAAVAAGPAAVRIILPWLPETTGHPDMMALLSFILFQPLIEEWIFRGQLQPWLRRHLHEGAGAWLVSPSNLTTSVLFAGLHLLSHSVMWSAAVVLPSLVFGWFRERHGHIAAGVVLHAVYNACYLAGVQSTAGRDVLSIVFA